MDSSSDVSSNEDELWSAWRHRKDLEARRALIDRYIWLARSIALRTFHRWNLGEDIDSRDLVQFGLVGLIEAVDRYDPEQGIDFPGFAKKRIRGAVIDGLSDETEMRAQLAAKRERRRERIRSLSDHGSPNDQLLRLIDITVGTAIGILLEDTGMFVDESRIVPSPYHSGELSVLREQFGHLVSRLPEKHLKVIQYHYFNDIPFKQIAAVLGVSSARVSQLHAEALLRLRGQFVRAGPLDDWV